MTTPSQSPTEMLRNYASVNAIVKKREAKAALDLTQNQIDSGFDRLVQCGQLTRIGHGIYKFDPTVEKPVFDVQEKIWRAMKVKRVFSSADIALLAETSVAYVYKLFRKYRAEDFIKNAGARRPTHGSGAEKLYRLTLKGQNKARQPNIEQFTPDPLVMDTVNLNRLVCSGMVARDEESAEQAIALCREIVRTIEEDLKG